MTQIGRHHPDLVLIVDSSEPWPHGWRFHAPTGVTLRRGKLTAGSLALAGAEDGVVVRRLTAGELVARIGRDREAFEAELARGRQVDRFVVVIEADLGDVVAQAGRVRPASILGTLAAWTRRGCAFQFCGGPELAAAFSFRLLMQPHAEALRFAAAVSRAAMPPAPVPQHE